MSEAQALEGQFRGWQRDVCAAKLLKLALVIRDFRPISFQFSLDRNKFYEIYAPSSPKGLANPQFISCFAIVSGVARYAKDVGGNIPVEFIFDEQDGVDIDVQLWFNAMKSVLPRRIKKLISGTPLFRNDKQIIQLQAADMLAWHLRREHERRDSDEKFPVLDLLRRSGEHLLIGEINEATLRRWAKHHDSMPAIANLKTKPQWRKFKKQMAILLSSGFIPPRGTRWKNFLYYARERIARFFKKT
jgi:hypothetical protein